MMDLIGTIPIVVFNFAFTFAGVTLFGLYLNWKEGKKC